MNRETGTGISSADALILGQYAQAVRVSSEDYSRAETCTSAAAEQKPVDLANMIAAVEKLKSIGPPPEPIRIHPLDFEELARTLPYPNCQYINSFCGVPLIVDPMAARLPRKRR